MAVLYCWSRSITNSYKDYSFPSHGETGLIGVG